MAGLALHSALLNHSQLINILSYDQQALIFDLHDGSHPANILDGPRRLAWRFSIPQIRVVSRRLGLSYHCRAVYPV